MGENRQMDTVSRFAEIILSHRFDLTDEKRLQSQIAEVLENNDMPFDREYHLSDQDICDFRLADGVIVECKLKGQRKMEIYRQLQRYARHDETKHIILATNVPMGLPEEIEGKPAYYISVSRGWL